MTKKKIFSWKTKFRNFSINVLFWNFSVKKIFFFRSQPQSLECTHRRQQQRRKCSEQKWTNNVWRKKNWIFLCTYTSCIHNGKMQFFLRTHVQAERVRHTNTAERRNGKKKNVNFLCYIDFLLAFVWVPFDWDGAENFWSIGGRRGGWLVILWPKSKLKNTLTRPQHWKIFLDQENKLQTSSVDHFGPFCSPRSKNQSFVVKIYSNLLKFDWIW